MAKGYMLLEYNSVNIGSDGAFIENIVEPELEEVINKDNTSVQMGISIALNNDVALMSSESSSYSYRPYTRLYTYPNRIGQMMMCFTWNTANASDDNNVIVCKVWKILTRTHPDHLEKYSTWGRYSEPHEIWYNLGDDCVYEDITNLSECQNGELYRTETSLMGYYILFLVTYSNVGGWGYKTEYTRTQTRDFRIGTISTAFNGYEMISLDSSMSGTKILEFRRSDLNYGANILNSSGVYEKVSDESILNEFLLTSMSDMDLYGYGDERMYSGYAAMASKTLTLWELRDDYRVKIVNSSYITNYDIINAVTDAIGSLNKYLSPYGFWFSRTTGDTYDIAVYIEDEDIYEDDYGNKMGGYWVTYDDGAGTINRAEIFIASTYFYEFPVYSYATMVSKLFMAIMYNGQCQYEYPYNTLLTHANHLNMPDRVEGIDGYLLGLAYSGHIQAGNTVDSVSKTLSLPKGVIANSNWSTSASIEEISLGNILDINTEWDVRGFVVNSDGKMSYTSDWQTITISIPQIGKPTTLNVTKRTNNLIRVMWDKVYLANRYLVQALSTIAENSVETTVTTNYFEFIPKLGKTGNFVVRARLDLGGGRVYTGNRTAFSISTNPSRPIINITSTKNGVIQLTWTLEDTSSNYEYIYVNIYDSDGEKAVGATITGTGKSSDTKTGTLELIIPDKYDNNSGDGIIQNGTEFELRVQVEYKGLKCLTDDGEEYKLILPFTIGNRPPIFQWASANNPSIGFQQGEEFKLTEDEVGDLMLNINQVRKYMGYEEYWEDGHSDWTIWGTTFTAERYNRWVDAIQGIDGFGSYLRKVSRGEMITADLLNIIVSELNVVDKEV